MKNSDLASYIKQQFSNKTEVRTAEMSACIKAIFPNLTSNTVAWRINQLKKEALIFQKGRGVYTFEYKPEFKIELSLKAKRLYNRITPLCKGDVSVWNTLLLNQLSGVEIDKSWNFISVPKEELSSLFDSMLDFSRNVYMHYDKETFVRYGQKQDDVIILTPLVSETPLVTNNGYMTPSIEGILVSAWIQYDAFLKPLGYDIRAVFEGAFDKYNINQSKLLRYAARRDKREEINNFIKTL